MLLRFWEDSSVSTGTRCYSDPSRPKYMIIFRLEFIWSSSSWRAAGEHSLIWGGGGVRNEERTKLEIDDDALESSLLSATHFWSAIWTNNDQISVSRSRSQSAHSPHRPNELNRSSWILQTPVQIYCPLCCWCIAYLALDNRRRYSELLDGLIPAGWSAQQIKA